MNNERATNNDESMALSQEIRFPFNNTSQESSKKFQVQIKIKSGGLHPILKSNQVKSERSDLDFKSNQFNLT